MGILDKIKNAFSDNAENSNDKELFEKTVLDTYEEIAQTTNSFWNANIKDTEVYQTTVSQWTDKQRVEFIVFLIGKTNNYYLKKGYGSKSGQMATINNTYIEYLLKTKIDLDEDDVAKIYHAFSVNQHYQSKIITHWPIGYFLARVESKFGKNVLPPLVEDTLSQLKVRLETDKVWDEKQKLKLIDRVNALLNAGNNETIQKTSLLGKDELKTFVDETIAALPDNEKTLWYQLIDICNKATGSKPTTKFLTQTKQIISELGEEKFAKTVSEFFKFIIKYKEVEKTNTYTSGGREYSNIYYEFLNASNMDSMKGFVWACCSLSDNSILNTVADLAERGHRKIPQNGFAAVGLGNACFYTLYKSEGMTGIGLLSRLKLRIKQTSTQTLIEKYLLETAKEKGVSIYEIEDISADDFELIDGKREVKFDGYTAELSIKDIGKTEIRWIKPDGSPQKTTPVFVTEKYAEEFKSLKDSAKNIEKMLSAHRDRIDRMFRAERKMTFEYFTQYYLNHGLIGFIAQKIIWNFEFEGKTQAAVYQKNKWICNEGVPVEISKNAVVSLWHPAVSSVEEVKVWRDFINTIQLKQPVKQAYREIYILTDAELNTKSYSNRMAAHLLKQHQFNMLAKTRGWKYALLGCYDDGRENEMAELKLPEAGLKAQFWVCAVEADNAFNDTGIWNYVSTDQIRFTKLDDGYATVDLIDVPAVPFSETLRDVDLFVGVASVGNDPQWADSGGGLPQYHNYWTAYSFGELSEVAKTRKEILERIIPRLKIAKVAEIRDKFLVIRGKLRTYKIHIGSTNILMEPNDQYLCIVPDRREKDYTQNIFLPFEGDSGLSVVLSKAFLLADDDKITDTTITSQIKRKQ